MAVKPDHMTELLADLLMEIISEDEVFMNSFCEECDAGCKANRRHEECPAGWSPFERECERNNRWYSLQERITNALSDAIR